MLLSPIVRNDRDLQCDLLATVQVRYIHRGVSLSNTTARTLLRADSLAFQISAIIGGDDRLYLFLLSWVLVGNLFMLGYMSSEYTIINASTLL